MNVAEKNSNLTWLNIGTLTTIPRQGSKVFTIGGRDIAVFRNVQDEIFALEDRCPHKGGPLSQGMVHGRRVTCPLHSWVIELADGNAVAPDVGCAKPFPVKVDEGAVYLGVVE